MTRYRLDACSSRFTLQLGDGSKRNISEVTLNTYKHDAAHRVFVFAVRFDSDRFVFGHHRVEPFLWRLTAIWLKFVVEMLVNTSFPEKFLYEWLGVCVNDTFNARPESITCMPEHTIWDFRNDCSVLVILKTVTAKCIYGIGADTIVWSQIKVVIWCVPKTLYVFRDTLWIGSNKRFSIPSTLHIHTRF